MTVVLGLLLLVATAYACLNAVFAGFIGDRCGDVTCDYPLLTAGLLVALIGPPVILTGATVAAFLLVAWRRTAFVAPLTGLVLVAAVLLAGLGIALAAVPGASLF